jgi:hypothetical protein
MEPMVVPKNKPAQSFPVQPFVVPPQVRIGHVHLKVADLERALRFYVGVLGFEITQRFGNGAVFLSFCLLAIGLFAAWRYDLALFYYAAIVVGIFVMRMWGNWKLRDAIEKNKQE